MDFKFVDADNHYYESEDAFTRYASPRMISERYVRWLTEADGKRRRLFFGNREANVIGNPTFDPCAKPGAYHKLFKDLEVGELRSAKAYGELVPIDPAYRDREARLATMDRQGIEKAVLFPTLGVTVEGLMTDDADMLYQCFHAFNRWLDDAWGFSYRDRIYAPAYLSMLDLERAIVELEWVLERGARLVTIRPGPAYGRSPADPYFDPFWARIDEAGLLVTYHALEGPTLYTEAYRQHWAAPPQRWSAEHSLLQRVVAGSDYEIMDTLSALVLHGLFERFPNVRVASIELGARWVPYLLRRLDHATGTVRARIAPFGTPLSAKPSEILQQHLWVSPFPEEDIAGLAGVIGVGHVIMGSDWPHAEATPEPADYREGLNGFDDEDVKRIMRDNALALLTS
jgi:predicted TIM-barrel fold metal-dependent hydrolase